VWPPPARHANTRWVGSRSTLSAALVAAVLVVYAPALTLGFVNFDDPQYVLDNAYVHSGLTRNGIGWALTATYAGNWHPVTWLSHMTDVELYGVNPGGHHATSVLIHLLNTLLLFAIMSRMTGKPLRSAVVAGLFGVHPLHVESVAWIAERKDVLSTLFALLTLWAYVGYVETQSRARYGLLVLFFVLGLASKPMLVTLPFLLLLLDIWPLQRITLAAGARLQSKALVLEKIPLFICAVLSSVATYAVQQSAGAVRAVDTLPLIRRFTNAIVAYVGYIEKTMWPVHLAPLYPYSATEPLWRIAIAAALLIALTSLAVRLRARYKYVPVGWFWYLGTLVPVIGLVQVGSQPMADRYTYLPVVGLFIVVAWGLPDWLHDVPGRRYLLAVAATGVVTASVVLARQQVAIWENSVELWQHTLRVTANNYRAHNNLALALVAAGKSEEALLQFEAALRIEPDSVEAHTGLGAILASAGKLEDAMTHYRHALRSNPNDAITRANLGAALAQQGNFAEAEAQLRAAVAIAPDLPQGHSYLGVALARQGRTAEAIGHFARVVELQPSDGAARRHHGAALALEGRTDEAIVQFETALRLDPADAQARNGLGDALAATGKLEAAALEYERAVRMNPAFAEARANLGNSLARLGRADEAIVQLAEAVRIRPDDSESRYDLAVVLWRTGRVAEAREQLEALVRQDPAHEAARRMLMDLRKRETRSQSPGPER
jgi:tetratricopeptide (TPR) repeat protein